LSDQVRAASALLTAYERSGRLPYAMLAEELMQFARRVLWDERVGGFFDRATVADDAVRTKSFVLNCEAARVLTRLGGLRGDSHYQEIVAAAPSVTYATDAARAIASQAPYLRELGPGAAIYGIALLELQSAI
jgi:uncharacterized protein YyaL (SSP411 family)